MGLALAQGALAGSAVHPTRLSVDRYGLDEGLSQLSVTAIAQDDSGFLWIGTQEGLNRFDGQRFLVLRESGGLPISSIVPDTMAIRNRSAETRSRRSFGTGRLRGRIRESTRPAIRLRSQAMPR